MRLINNLSTQQLALLIPLMFILSSHALAQSSLNPSSQEKIPGIPGTVPKSGDIFLREQKRTNKKSNPKGSNTRGTSAVAEDSEEVSAEPSDEASLKPKPGELIEAENLAKGLKLPSVNQIDPKSGQTINNREDSAQANTKLLPHLEMGPPAGIAAYLGQTLVLRAKPKFLPASRVPANIAWILNGKVICQKLECEIPLDGKTMGIGTAYLMIVVYNAYGSTSTRHVVQVLKSKWNPSMAFMGSYRKEEPAIAIKVPIHQASENAPKSYMLRGNAVQSYPETLNVLGSVPQTFAFRGVIKTQDTAVARIKDPSSGDWFILGFSDVKISPESKALARNLEIRTGGVRLHLFSQDKENKPRQQKVSFADNVALSTNELSATPTIGGDIYVTRLKPSKKALARAAAARQAGLDKAATVPEAQISTRVIVISGQAKVTLAKTLADKPKELLLPPGVELIVYEDGSIAPLAKPNPRRMAKLMRMTVTPEEILEKSKQKSNSMQNNIDIKDIVMQANKLLETEDYFEVLNLVAPFEDRAKEEPRICYLLGIANKGTYQLEEAEKYFLRALELDPTMADAHWQLAQLQLEGKNWEKALVSLNQTAAQLANEDPRNAELPYYKGVVKFNLGSNFSARNAFTQALWEESLDSALKQSAASFLQNLGKKRNWSLVFPVGMQYDHNALGLGNNDPLVTPFTQRNLVRTILGMIFNWDSAINAQSSGTYWGASTKAMALHNFPSSFNSLNAFVSDLTLSQSFISVGEKNPDNSDSELSVFKLYESFGLVTLNGKMSTATSTVGFNFKKWEIAAAYEHDLIEKGTSSKSSAVLRQSLGLELWSSESGSTLDLDIGLEQRAPLHKSDINPQSLSASLNPGYSVALSPRASTKFALGVGGEWKFSKPLQSTSKLNPNASFNYFLFPWLLAVTSASYEIQSLNPSQKKIHKPGASFILTGLF